MDPGLEQAAEEYRSSVDLVRIDISTGLHTAETLGAKGTPTLIGLAAGREVFRHTGRLRLQELEQLFSALADEKTPTPRSRTDLIVRLGAGTVLTILGLVTGPSWALVIVGGAVMAFGLAPLLKWDR
jgi:thiol-disulfide isomerase/thioredoxin